jgi:RNA polymerase sigma-70 factor, ECF subfamily
VHAPLPHPKTPLGLWDVSHPDPEECLPTVREVGLTDRRARATELYRLYGPSVYRRCLRLLKEPEAARDATQEVFVRLVRHLDRLNDRETVLPWIYRVATNYCLNLRRDARRRGEDAPMPDLELASGDAASPFPERRLACQVLAHFDLATQAVAVGVLVDGMEHQEAATALGISRRTVARRLDRFLDGARRFLGRDVP